jgi:hypothetical protein
MAPAPNGRRPGLIRPDSEQGGPCIVKSLIEPGIELYENEFIGAPLGALSKAALNQPNHRRLAYTPGARNTDRNKLVVCLYDDLSDCIGDLKSSENDGRCRYLPTSFPRPEGTYQSRRPITPLGCNTSALRDRNFPEALRGCPAMLRGTASFKDYAKPHRVARQALTAARLAICPD